MTIVASPVPAIAVDASKSLEVQALAINAAANQLRTTIAGVWDLSSTSAQPPAPESTVFHPRVLPGQESVLEGDERTLVDPKHYAPGGKYRSIVKLLIKYSEKPNSMAHGTGWLIRPDLIATAGHNVYDWGHNAGRAVEIKCYAGWEGTSKFNESSNVEFRKAARVVTTERWLQTRGSKPHDFALIQVDKPFTNVTPFKYIETPPFEASTRLGVVGYPAETRDANGERGARMYEMFLDTSYNLEKQADTMIEYSIDTEGGQSGSPVFLENGLVAIGAHVYGGALNAASVLGRYGNPIQDYIAALDVKIDRPDQINLFTIADDVVAAKGAATGKQSSSILTQLEGGESIGPVAAAAAAAATSTQTQKPKYQEGFFDSIADVFKITERASLLLGPLGEPIRAASLLAGEVAKRASQSTESSFDEESKTARILPPATLQRAQLARANVIALTKATAKANPEGFFDDLGDLLGKAIKPLVPAFIPPLAQPGFIGGLPFNEALKAVGIGAQMADRAVADVAQSVAQAMFLVQKIPLPGTAKTEGALEDFASEVAEALRKVFEIPQNDARAQAEGFFDDILFPGIVKAVDIGKQVSGTIINRELLGAEGFFDSIQQPVTKVNKGTAKGPLPTGAVVGMISSKTEASLERTGPTQRKSNRAEGFFDDLSDTFNDMGSLLANPQKLADRINDTINFGQTEGIFDDVTDFFPVIKGVAWVVEAAANPESSVEGVDASSFPNNILNIARAFLLRGIIEEQYLKATIARPVEELKAEGWFDDVNDAVEGAVMWGWDRIKESAAEEIKKDEEGRRPFTPFRTM